MRIVGIVGLCAAVAGFFLILGGVEVPGTVLILLGLAAQGVVRLIGGVRELRSRVRDIQSLVSGGDPQAGHIVEVGRPKGLFSPRSNVVIEQEDADGSVNRIERTVPVAMPYAIAHLLSRWLKLPLVSDADLGELLEFELRSKGTQVELGGDVKRD